MTAVVSGHGRTCSCAWMEFGSPPCVSARILVSQSPWAERLVPGSRSEGESCTAHPGCCCLSVALQEIRKHLRKRDMGYFWDDLYLQMAYANQMTWQGRRDKVVAAFGSSQPCTPALCCGSFPLCTPASPPLALCPPLHDSIIPGKEGPLPKMLPWICGICSWPKGKGWRALRRSGSVR